MSKAGDVPPKLRRAVLDRDGWRCRMLRDGQPCGLFAAHADHITPWRDGGPTALWNLRAACADCNTRAGAHLNTTPPTTRPELTSMGALLVTMLDQTGAPHDVGRRTARRLLGDAYRWVPSAELDRACAYRRWRFLASQTSRW